MNITPIYLGHVNCGALPAAYDDSLSYMEAIAKFQFKLNELIEQVNQIDSDAIDAALAAMSKEIADNYEEVQREFDNLEAEQKHFFQSVNQQITAIATKEENDIADIRSEMAALNTSIQAVVDQKIASNNEYIFDTISSELIGVKVVNYFTGEKVTIQEMFDFLCKLHATEGITVNELIARNKTTDDLIAYHMTYTQLAFNGKNIIV